MERRPASIPTNFIDCVASAEIMSDVLGLNGTHMYIVYATISCAIRRVITPWMLGQ